MMNLNILWPITLMRKLCLSLHNKTSQRSRSKALQLKEQEAALQEHYREAALKSISTHRRW